jgi:2-polyprenyl-6-hydroxyphenyl methylase/3-demethylubiquinone-9 3-methyltransferase
LYQVGPELVQHPEPENCAHAARIDFVLGKEAVPSGRDLLDKPRAVRLVHRVRRVGGVFICLTPNGGYCWYRHLAPRLGLDTRHLSTDRFLSTRELETLIGGARLTLQRFEHWRFIPQGDLPVGWGCVLRALDWVGGHLRVGVFRGGIAFSAVRTDRSPRRL